MMQVKPPKTPEKLGKTSFKAIISDLLTYPQISHGLWAFCVEQFATKDDGFL